MRKRTAGLLGTGAVLLIAGYVAWCGRTFFLKTRMETTSHLPEEVAAVLPQALEKAGMTRPEKFRMERFLHYLSHPYEKRWRLNIISDTSDPAVITVTRIDRLPYGARSPVIYFMRRGGKWQQVTPLEYQDYKGRWNVNPWKKSAPPKGLDDLMREGLS